MGMFSNLMGKIFAHAPAASTPSAPAPAPSTPASPPPTPTGDTPTTPTTPAPDAPVPTATTTPPPPAQPAAVDVTAILDGLAANNSESLDWRKSIVDLLKLVDMDSGLSARRELAQELGYAGDHNDSGAMNVWLHKAVIKKLAENGGKVPAELLG